MKISLQAVGPAPLANNGPKATYSSPELAGRSVHALRMVLGGTFTKAMISNIQMKVGGRVIMDSISGTQLDQMNYHDTNVQEDATHLTIWFGDPSASTPYGKHATDLDLSVIRGPGSTPTNPVPANIELNVTYTGATGPTLVVWADCELPKGTSKKYQNGEPGLIKAWITSQLTPGAAVTTQQQNGVGIGQDANAGILTSYWFHDSHMTALQVYKDGAVELDNVSQTDSDSWALIYAHPTIANLYVYDYNEQHDPTHVKSSLKGVHSNSGSINPDPKSPAIFQWKLTTNAASVINVINKVMVNYAAFGIGK